MLTASQVYTYTRRILDAYAAVMQPLSAELDMTQNAVDILLFLANNPGLDTARDICTYRKLKPGIVSFHVDNLVREGYLLRTRDPGDRRRCRQDRQAAAREEDQDRRERSVPVRQRQEIQVLLPRQGRGQVMSFRVHREGELEYLTSDVLDGAAHCFSTRFGGVSEGALASLNLGTHRGDKPENVRENYRILVKAVGFAPEETVFTRQEHTDLLLRVGRADCGTGLDRGHDAGHNRGNRRIARRPGHVLIRCVIGLNRCGQRRGFTTHSKLKVRSAEFDARHLYNRSGYRNRIRGCRDPINRCRDRGITVTDSGNKTVSVDGKDALVGRGPNNLAGLVIRGDLCLQLLSRAFIHGG